MTMRWLVVIALVVAGCKKHEGSTGASAKPEPTETDDKPAPKGTDDSWASVASGGDTKLGAKTGDDLAKLEVPKPTQLAAKVDVATLEKPVSAKVELMGFSTGGGVGELTGFKVVYNPGHSPSHE